MFSSAHRETQLVRLRAELAEARDEACRYDRVALEDRRAVGLAAVVTAPEERYPRLRQDTAYLRSLIDRRRSNDIKELLRGRPYLLGEYVRIGPNQTALTYAMNQDQDQGMRDIVTVLQKAAGDGSE